MVVKRSCLTTKQIITATSHSFERNIIGDAIAKDRLDIIELLGNKSVDWNVPCLQIQAYQKINYTPLQYALIMKRSDIATYLVSHGALIK